MRGGGKSMTTHGELIDKKKEKDDFYLNAR